MLKSDDTLSQSGTIVELMLLFFKRSFAKYPSEYAKLFHNNGLYVLLMSSLIILSNAISIP